MENAENVENVEVSDTDKISRGLDGIDIKDLSGLDTEIDQPRFNHRARRKLAKQFGYLKAKNIIQRKGLPSWMEIIKRSIEAGNMLHSIATEERINYNRNFENIRYEKMAETLLSRGASEESAGEEVQKVRDRNEDRIRRISAKRAARKAK